jgi:hypothetical protein
MAMPASRLWASEPASAQPAIWDRSRTIRLVLHDPLDHPFYWWPRTLLSYPIEFHQAVALDRLVLTRVDTGEKIPIQFSGVVRDGGEVKSATLHFFSDLPSGARREFVLAAANAPGAMKPLVSEVCEGNTIVLDSGAVRVRIPAGQAAPAHAPGPVMQFCRGGQWIGSSSLTIDGDKVAHIASNRVESGLLFIAYEITYETAHGSRYVARVQCNGGQDFVRLQENMEGLPQGVRGTLTTDWTGLDATHRQAPNHPFPLPDKVAAYDSYPWEKIDDPWRSSDIQFGASLPPYPTVFPAGQVPFKLGIYQTWTALHVGTFANFWNGRTGDALGVFIDKVGQWQDHEYAYEVESPALEVTFFHREEKFYWTWPLAHGSRSTCLAFYDHEKDKAAMRELERSAQSVEKDGYTYHVPLSLTSHVEFLQNRFGTLNLNCVKDWVLAYPENGRRPPVIFDTGMVKDGADLERRILTSDFIGTLPVFGTRQNGGHGSLPGRGIVNFSPVPCRQVLGWWVDGFNRLSATMTARQRERLTAMFLFIAYVHAGEDFMPMVPMLSGHPNFLADVKATPAVMAFLFPDHPMATAWANLWEKYVELNTRFNTRPAVATWNAEGGRWTEDLGTYVWAFLRPSLRTEYLMRKYDGQERFVTPQLAQMADWLVNSLSAPFNGESEEAYRLSADVDGGHEWGVLAPGKGPRRVHPPQGAHAERRVPPRSLWYLGTCLQRYAPLAAEHAMWAARPTNQDMETALGSVESWDAMYRGVADNRGTNPHLRSEKFTGYGIVLRSAVDTGKEVSVHLQQIDRGPNYRWGVTAEGGCGVIYFFAGGKAYSTNGAEDVGDRKDQDTDFCTNFGVFKNGSFRSIGENVLSRPFYNLGAGQFAEIVPRIGDNEYSAPEYVSRSVLLAGSEYFVLYDALVDQTLIHRLSWFVRRGDELPFIKLVRGGSGDARATQRTDLKTNATTGVWFDGVGDSLAVVSHRSDLQVEAADFGCRVRTDGVEDLVFRGSRPIHHAESEMVFDGTAGLIRSGKDKTEFALFHGTRIGVPGIIFSTSDTDLGIGGSIVAGQAPSGAYCAPQASSVTIAMPSLTDKTLFYVDGEARAVRHEHGSLAVELPAGIHRWELTDALPVPVAPHVARTESRAGGARVVVAAVAAATRYRLELSRDNGATWRAVDEQAQPSIEVSGLNDGDKVHVRAVALNSLHESLPGPEYPLYVTSQPPPPPDGLHVELADGAAALAWGEVLGASAYRLYVRARSDREFRLLYHGLDRTFVDKRTSIKACDAVPGEPGSTAPAGIFEYRVAAVNGNGEGAASRSADSDPASWRNWDPRPGERFRRVYSYPPDTPQLPGAMPRYYPD